MNLVGSVGTPHDKTLAGRMRLMDSVRAYRQREAIASRMSLTDSVGTPTDKTHGSHEAMDSVGTLNIARLSPIT